MKKECVVGKRGLSPVIATVLLVMLVLVLAALIFLWARGLISEQIEKSGEAIENVCSEVSFDVTLNNNNLEIVNRGTVSIYGFNLKFFKGGDSTDVPLEGGEFSAGVGKSWSQNVATYLSEVDNPEKIVVSPILLGNVRGTAKENKPYTCNDMGQTITL